MVYLLLFPEVMRHSENYIQKSDGSFRNSSLISPILFLVLQSVGREIYKKYTPQRPSTIGAFYAGNYEYNRPTYKQDYDEFSKAINAGVEQNQYFIKTDISSFYGNINVNELVDRINKVCNKDSTVIPQSQLLLLKELLLYCVDGYYPLIENSMATSYLATIVYLDMIDSELYEFICNKADDITSFQMYRYVDDLYILFSSEKSIEQLTPTYNSIRSSYSSILKKYSLSLNAEKCALKHVTRINEELKKSQYDEEVNGIRFEMGELFQGTLERFLKAIYERITFSGLTNEQYKKLIEEFFKAEDIEFTPEEVFNYMVFENQEELKRPEVSEMLVKIIRNDVSFLSIDPKRLAVMVMRTGNEITVKAMLNQLFIRFRSGLWNSYDTTIAISYMIQSRFRHLDLLKVLSENCPGLYAYYKFSCGTSFICQIFSEKWNRYLRCVKMDKKAPFLFFMSMCERNRSNYLGAFAYYKNFFDRISADMAFLTKKDPQCRRPNYKGYYHEGDLKKLYREIPNSDDVINQAHKLRNSNPLSHSSAGLIDSDSSSKDILTSMRELDELIEQYARIKQL